MKKFFILLIAFLICLFISDTALFAQHQDGKLIITVKVNGNKAVSTSVILAKIRAKPGDKFSQDVLNDDLKRLYALGYFTDVSIDVEDYEGGVMVTIIVEEKPVIKDIVLKGNKKINTERLKKAMQTKPGDMMDYSRIAQDVSEVKALYESKGFHFVDVKYTVEVDKETNSAVISMTVHESERVRVKKISVEGNVAVKANKVKELMKTRPAWFFSRGYFNEELFEEDLEKIKSYYGSLGYLDVEITPSFDYDDTKELMYITLHMNEGRQYLVGDIEIEGDLVFPEAEILKRISMDKGKPFNYAELRMDVDNIRQYYYGEGYMNVDVDVERVLDAATGQIGLAYKIEPGEIVYIGKVEVRGNTKTKDVVVRRELRAYPGERFDGDDIRKSKERLYNLGYFEDIYFDTKPTDDPSIMDLIVNVKETKTGEFAFGGGYSSIDEFIGFVQITQKNFDILNFPYFTGDGQNLSIRAEIGSVRRDYEISWTEPWIFDYPLSFGVDLYNRTHLRRTDVGYGYQEMRSGGDARFGKEFTDEFRSDLMYKLERVDITKLASDATQDLKDEEGDSWISALSLGMTYDVRDNIFTPTKGFISSAYLEDAGGILFGEKDFLKLYSTTSFYYTPIQNITIEFKARAGIADSYADTKEVPIYERFYAGGAYTVRGYKERKVGPRDPGSGDPVGGEATLIGNAEVTFPIYPNLIKGAIFYDVGNVWRRWNDFLQGGFKQGAGAGVRVKTPIGPLRLDVGYPLSDNYDDKKQVELYFSVSHGF